MGYPHFKIFYSLTTTASSAGSVSFFTGAPAGRVTHLSVVKDMASLRLQSPKGKQDTGKTCKEFLI